ncbi:hypothetical protein [Neobacillus niacini]|uniref:hypothetical protein n=1 Tax=Neobacillus niacini TaxID=86668 RepID=UPI0021CB8D52|nr:hypothetical protein [Neobacillus niacini]MCM3767653.1 hypothetical protein [Neobacillus niacini]
MSLDQMLGLFGLLVGALGGAFGLWWGRKQAARKRGLDERYEKISVKSLAASWKITLVAIYILFILFIFGVKLTVAPVLGILIFIHLAGWTFSIIYYNLKI